MKKILLVSLLSICLAFLSSCSTEVEAALCSSCGEEKGAEQCCATDAEKCGKCGKNKGSPGCCK